MDKERFLSSGLIEQYVLGLCSPEEEQQVLRYAEAFPEIKEEIDGMRKAMEEYARQYAVPPPPHLKEKVMKTIDTDGGNRGNGKADWEVRPGAGANRSAGWAVMFSLLAIAVLGYLSFSFYSQYRQTQNKFDSLAARFEIYKENCEQAQAQQAELEKIYAFLRHEDTQPVRLSGTGLAPEAETLVYINPTARAAYLNVVNLPEPPANKTYQLWADVHGEMINMGVIDSSTTELQLVNFIDEAESLNITLEPAGGSEHPTVELLYVRGAV